MDEINEHERWYEITDAISALIAKTEVQRFVLMSNRHGLVKINKKLYEALEIAQKALEKGETE